MTITTTGYDHRRPPALTRGNVDDHRRPPAFRDTALRAQAREAPRWSLHPRVWVALKVGGAAILLGLMVMLLSTDNWQASFIGGGLTAAGVLTLCIAASVQTDISRRAVP